MGAVGIAKLETPKALSTSEANKRRNYPVPKPDVMYWPKGFVTPLPILVEGQRFSIDLPVPGPGFYEISVWGKRPGDADYASVSLRTLHVE